MRIAAILLLLTISASAAVKDIKADKLPVNPRVQAVYQDVSRLEPMALRWSPEWKHEQSKDSVKKQLATNLSILRKEATATPNNAELWLLVSVVARYAYNLDVADTNETVVGAAEMAQKLAPTDIRGRWFLAMHQCQTMDFVNTGMQMFLAIEAMTPDQLPASFWDDYMECATIANMPAHLLRAADRRRKIDPDLPELQTFLSNGALQRFDTFDTAKKYDFKDFWLVKNDPSFPVFSSDMFGFSFVAKSEWPLNPCIPDKLQCVVDIEAGPFMNGKEKVSPHILVIARQPKKDESLADFLKSFMRYEGAHPVDAPCPSDQCLTQEAVIEGMYKQNGDGHAIMTALEREEPTSPGVLWEEPNGPTSVKTDKPAYFRPNQRMKRLPGTMFYLVMLDTASTVYPEAKAEYDRFLRSMRVE